MIASGDRHRVHRFVVKYAAQIRHCVIGAGGLLRSSRSPAVRIAHVEHGRIFLRPERLSDGDPSTTASDQPHVDTLIRSARDSTSHRRP